MFSKVMVPFFTATRSLWEFHFLHSLPALAIFSRFNFRHSGVSWCLSVVLICIPSSLMMYILMYIFASQVSFVCMSVFKNFAHLNYYYWVLRVFIYSEHIIHTHTHTNTHTHTAPSLHRPFWRVIVFHFDSLICFVNFFFYE